MDRKVLAQGDRDGACFLYSVANASVALTSKSISRAIWTKAIKAIPYKLEDFIAGRGTENLDDQTEMLVHLCERLLANFSKSKFIVKSHRVASANALSSKLAVNRIAIVAVDEGNHWVVVVDSESDSFQIACSAAALESPADYTEKQSSRLDRTYNTQRRFPEMRLWEGYALVVERLGDA